MGAPSMPQKRITTASARALTTAAIALILISTAWAAPKYKVLHSFKGTDGDGPWGGVTLSPDGRIYGTTIAGGTHDNAGTAFRLTPSADGSWREAILHNFYSWPDDGAAPIGGILVGADGGLYGETELG